MTRLVLSFSVGSAFVICLLVGLGQSHTFSPHYQFYSLLISISLITSYILEPLTNRK